MFLLSFSLPQLSIERAERVTVATDGTALIQVAPDSESATLVALLEAVRNAWVDGVDTVEEATQWLDQGAARVVMKSTAHRAALLEAIPHDRLAVAGATGDPQLPAAVAQIVADKEAALALKGSSETALIVVRNGSTADVAALDKAGIVCCLDVSGEDEDDSKMLSATYASVLQSDRADGLWTTMVVDERGVALGLVYSNEASLCESLRTRRGVFHSRKRGLWRKGETSGAIQELLGVSVDCDRDCLVFRVRQHGSGFCHLNTRTCMGDDRGLGYLERTLRQRRENAPSGSYTARLFSSPAMLGAKLREEADELARAETPREVALEAADVLFFALTRCVAEGVTLDDVEAVLDRRSRKLTRRPGNTKKQFEAKPKVAVVDAEKATEETPEQAEKATPEQSATEILRPYVLEDLSEGERARVCQRPAQDMASAEVVRERTRAIVERVRTEGDEAVIELTHKFDGCDMREEGTPVVDTATVLAAAMAKLSGSVRSAIDLAFGNIERFHRAQVDKDATTLCVETAAGVTCSRHTRALHTVGLYVPGGSAVLPSTAMMLGIPAMVAGCTRIVLASPPARDGSLCPEIVYIASKVGCKSIVRAGGAQAIAAMAYGTATVPKCDKICGPGNQYVTAAKMLVQTDTRAMCSIDMPAGPSELLVIADRSARPDFVASDLLSQAEHGPDSQVVLVTVSLTPDQIKAIQQETQAQLERLPRRDIARVALSKSFLMQTTSLSDALAFANEYAPEHLIVNADYGPDDDQLMSGVRNAGSVFLGPFSAESCGDYASGTNHTLPTYGYARQYSGVSTSTFQKHITSQHLTADGLLTIGDAVETLAAVEGLDAHRLAVVVRQTFIKHDRAMLVD